MIGELSLRDSFAQVLMQNISWKQVVGGVIVVLATGGVWMQPSVVRAGEWELILTEKYPAPTDWPAVSQFRSGGTGGESWSGLPLYETRNWEGGGPWNSMHPLSDKRAEGEGGLQAASVVGQVRGLLRWKPRDDENYQPDPTDKPPMFIAVDWRLVINAYAGTRAGSHSTINSISVETEISDTQMDTPPQSATQVPISQVIQYKEDYAPPPAPGMEIGFDNNPWHRWLGHTSRRRFLVLATQGQKEIWLPWVYAKAVAQANAGRKDVVYYSGESPYENATLGRADVEHVVDGRKVDIFLTPNPEGLALMDCSLSGLERARTILNQYVVDGHPFVIPCSASFSNSDWNGWGVGQSLADTLRDGLSWRLTSPPASLPQLEKRANSLSFLYGNFGTSGLVVSASATDNVSPTPSPTETPQPSATPTPIAGLGFNATTMPSSNDEFGPRTVEHLFNSIPNDPFSTPQVLATAPVALFYNATSTNHPNGGPSCVDLSGNLLTTQKAPNYIFYYDQAWKNPWNIEVRFWNKDSSASSPGQNFVKVGTDSHGLSGAGLYGGPDADGGIDTDLFARLTPNGALYWVGQQKIRGLDLYARNVYHECVHMRLRMAVESGALDSDEDASGNAAPDGLSDYIEIQMGTDPLDLDSTGWGVNANDQPNSYYPYADNEVFCRMCERDLPVPTAD